MQTDTVSILQDKAMSISFVPEDMVSAVMETTNAWYLPAPPFWTQAFMIRCGMPSLILLFAVQKTEIHFSMPAAARDFIPPSSERPWKMPAELFPFILACAARDRKIGLAVASISAIPIADSNVNLLINLFAPFDAAEFSRVMVPGGTLLRVFPDRRHLWELKEAIYDSPYENNIGTLALDGFSLISEQKLNFSFQLTNNEQITSLFQMTPYYYKTSREDQEKLSRLHNITVTAEFILVKYQKP